MAIVWRKTVNGTRYEVRAAGRTRRLYTNGVFHSQYNPAAPVTGGIWDLLLLPAYYLPSHALRRALVLGVGGGAVIRQLLHFLTPDEIVGVERDPVHLEAARRFFGLDDRRVRLHEADAVAWVRKGTTNRYDFIVEDVFGGCDGEPERAVKANADWFQALARCLSPDGVLVMNFLSPAELGECAYFSNRRVAKQFAAAFQLTHPLHENAIAAFVRNERKSSDLRRRLAGVPGLDPRLKSTRMRYRIRRLG